MNVAEIILVQQAHVVQSKSNDVLISSLIIVLLVVLILNFW